MSWLKYLVIALGLLLGVQIASARDIKSYTDDQGVLHINNGSKKQIAPANPSGPQASQHHDNILLKSTVSPPYRPSIPPLPAVKPLTASMAPLPGNPKYDALGNHAKEEQVMPVACETERQDRRTIASEVGSASLQRVSWSPSPLPKVLTHGKIVMRWDSQGILHITNEPLEKENQAVAGEPVAPMVQRLALAQPVVLQEVQEVSCPELGPEVAAYLKDKLHGFQAPEPGSTIQRYRDHGGIWCISNKSAPEAQLRSSQMAADVRPRVSAVAHAPPIKQIIPNPVGALSLERPSLAFPDRMVMARRDHRGVVHIFTSIFGKGTWDQDSPAAFLGRVSPLLQASIVEAAQLYRLPVPLILAVIRQESNFVHQAVSPKGAMGLMQLMPKTAASLGVQDPFDPRENILAGCRYLRQMLDYFQGSVPLALAAYNAGYKRVVSAGCQVPAIKETQEFVTQVMGLSYLLEKRATGL